MYIRPKTIMVPMEMDAPIGGLKGYAVVSKFTDHVTAIYSGAGREDLAKLRRKYDGHTWKFVKVHLDAKHLKVVTDKSDE